MHLFSSNHVQLITACYPPSSALLTSGPDYRPNTQELSRLTYYASNRPGKVNKLGSELEKRVKAECRKAQAGNTRSRASLLISLAILKALATECRRDISLLSPSLVAAVDATLANLPSDLEVSARAASVFTAWTTYTDGHLIGTDSNVTQSYMSTLRKFSNLGSTESNSADHEDRNRTRLIGLAALTGAVSSEALYNDSTQFRTQVSAIMRPLLVTILHVDLSLLDEQAAEVMRAPTSPYLAEFRTRPATERRAASIHVHIDGDKGPSMEDVTNACLHTLFSLLEHSHAAQLGHIMRATFGILDELNGWEKLEHCCWFARKASEWAQYQYRYAVPTWLVERLLESQDSPTNASVRKALAAMVTTVFNSPTPLVNLSTSDIMSNLMTLLLRRITIDPEDALLPALVECIASLGRHVYYSDQIQDLAMELIGRLVAVEIQGVIPCDKAGYVQSRSQAIRSLLAGLLGLVQAAKKNDAVKDQEGNGELQEHLGIPVNTFFVTGDADARAPLRPSRRTRVPPDIWQDTLSLLCDVDYAARADYSDALVFYLTHEIPKHGDIPDADGVKRMRPLAEGPLQQAAAVNMFLNSGDHTTKFLNAMHAYLYILATTPSLGISSSPLPSLANSMDEDAARTTTARETPPPSQSHGRRSLTLTVPRSRKISVVQRLIERVPSRVSASTAASTSDYAHILNILITVHEQLPVRGLLTSIPMLLALDGAARTSDADDLLRTQRVRVIKEVMAKVWLSIARVWNCSELLEIAEKAIACMSEPHLPFIHPAEVGIFHAPQEITEFSAHPNTTSDAWAGVDAEAALLAIVSKQNVQEATGLDRQGLLRRFANKWTVDSALKDSVNQAGIDTFRGDPISPLLKISPALMHIENLSLQSLARSARGVGVNDLREALEGRSSMSNPALVKPSSISTLDHTSSIMGGDMASNKVVPSRIRANKRTSGSRPGEVRDVLNRLGIGKSNGGSLLKASFPALQKTDQRIPPSS